MSASIVGDAVEFDKGQARGFVKAVGVNPQGQFILLIAVTETKDGREIERLYQRDAVLCNLFYH